MKICLTCSWWNKIGKGNYGRCEYVETDEDTFHGAWLWGRGPDERGLANRFNGELRTLPDFVCKGYQVKLVQMKLGVAE